MRKSDKKIDNHLRIVLTEVCETALKEFTGFQWLTHIVNYANFPTSLKVVCVFDTQKNLSSFLAGNQKDQLSFLIQTQLEVAGVKLKNMKKHLTFDSEELCKIQHNGQWATRLNE